MADGTQRGCTCTGAESAECTEVCPFAGGFEEYPEDGDFVSGGGS